MFVRGGGGESGIISVSYFRGVMLLLCPLQQTFLSSATFPRCSNNTVKHMELFLESLASKITAVDVTLPSYTKHVLVYLCFIFQLEKRILIIHSFASPLPNFFFFFLICLFFSKLLNFFFLSFLFIALF